MNDMICMLRKINRIHIILQYFSSIFIQFIWCYIYQFPFMSFSQYVFLLCRKTIYDMVGEQGITLTRTLVLAVALMALGTVHKWRRNFNFWPRVNWVAQLLFDQTFFFWKKFERSISKPSGNCIVTPNLCFLS